MARRFSKPMVASRGVGAAVDVVRDGRNGWLYEAEDQSALTAVLSMVVVDDELRRRAADYMHDVADEGTPRAVAEMMLSFVW